jgi:hypothetical protein
MEQTECSETSAYKIQTPGNYLEENIEQGNECYATKNFMAENFLIQKKNFENFSASKTTISFSETILPYAISY